MCKAHVLRFCCGHGVLMGIEPCAICPCPILKTTGVKLPRQPFKCYNCQYKRSSSSLSTTSSRDASCTSSLGSLDSTFSSSSTATTASSVSSSRPSITRKPSHPLPGVARQPTESIQYCATPLSLSRASTGLSNCSSIKDNSLKRSCNSSSKQQSKNTSFKFTCSSSGHYPTPHYTQLPTYLPHQDHPCPPCQFGALRIKSLDEAASQAKREFPHLTSEMLVRDGRRQEESPWFKELTLERYVDEKRGEERQAWHFVGMKWVQDLKRCKVLMAEEDGLGLLD